MTYADGGHEALVAYGLVKTAGRVDHEYLHDFAGGLRPGDVINFSANGPDVAEGSIRKGLSHLALSEPIRAGSGSNEHHTALFAGHDENGIPHIIHNYEQGETSGLRYEPLHNYADRTHFQAYRPQGVTDEQAAAAVARARELERSGTTHYSKRNLVGAAPAALTDNLEKKMPGNPLLPHMRRASRVIGGAMGEKCDPGSGICSFLPADAYGHVLGKERAVEMFSGKKIPWEHAQREISPAVIAGAPGMQALGRYSPKASAGRGISGYLSGLVGRGFNRLVGRR